MTTNIAQSKVQIVVNPVALPAICVSCRTSANGRKRFADVGASEEFYGAFYFCEDCVTEMANVFGLIHAAVAESTIDDLRAKNIELQIQLGEANTENVRLRAGLDSILVVRSDLSVDGYSNVDVDSTHDEFTDIESNNTESESDGPATERGPEDLFKS